ncbi:MAG: hypothetical protein OEV95_12020, partial [Gemmatimonadota bacterium]|nr:hypothetical protein [Gemmatimonadota bacterium]
SRVHPYSDPGQVALFTRLEDRIARASQLATQQREGTASVRASAARRRQLRRTIRRELLEHLVSTARGASKEAPELAQLFLVPAESGRHQDFMTSARAMTATATERKDLFLQHGMSPTLLDDLGRALDEYDATVLQANAGKRAHVGARADIDAVMREIMELVEQMEGINRYRFRADAELLAAWKSARDLPWGTGGQQEPVAPAA